MKNEAAGANEGMKCERPKRTMRLRFIPSFLHSQRQYCETLRKMKAEGDGSVRNDPLSIQSIEFAVSVIQLVKRLKGQHETIISNQIGRSGTSIGANIREAQYAHGKSDFIAKLQIALKEANETGYWLELLLETEYIDAETYQALERQCKSLRLMLISSLNTAKGNNDKLR